MSLNIYVFSFRFQVKTQYLHIFDGKKVEKKTNRKKMPTQRQSMSLDVAMVGEANSRYD